MGEGARLRGVSHDCFLIFNLSNGPHLLYHRWSTERTPRGPKAALTEHMPTIAKFRSRSNFRRRVGASSWLLADGHKRGAGPKHREAISLRATSNTVRWAKPGVTKRSKCNSTTHPTPCTPDKPGSRGSRHPSHPGTAGERDINICAESAGFSGAAAAPGSFAVASDVLNGHLWWGESPTPPLPRNHFLSERGDWRVVGGGMKGAVWKGWRREGEDKNSGRPCLFM